MDRPVWVAGIVLSMAGSDKPDGEQHDGALQECPSIAHEILPIVVVSLPMISSRIGYPSTVCVASDIVDKSTILWLCQR
jgi:hypothetical protein